MKVFHILTLFPEMFEGPFSESIIKRAKEKGLIDIHFHNLRDFGVGPRRQVDDTPYGGGAGMVLRFDVVESAISNIKEQISSDFALRATTDKKLLKTKDERLTTILLTPQGKKLDQKLVKNLASEDSDYLLICGHYEGYDERIRDLVDMEISVGDYVLTGGEIPAMVLVDSISRLIPGVLGKEDSFADESFENNLLEYPQYTRPEEYDGKKVPEILLSGNHAEIEKWRRGEAVKKTKEKRPDMF